MRWLIRPFTVLVSAGWLAFWIGVLWLLWLTDNYATLTIGGFDATGDVTADSTARWVASPLVALVAACALPALIGAVLPHRRPAAQPERPAGEAVAADEVRRASATPSVPASLRAES